MEINYVFSIGYRCNSVQFVRKYELSKFSGPFDWMYIDLESAIKNIDNEFSDYLTDIETLKDQDLFYMSQNYKETSLPINWRFTEPNGNNIYDWNKICIFLHHRMEEPEEIEKIKIRVQRFLNVMSESPDRTLLVYISKIIEGDKIDSEIYRIRNLVRDHNLKSNFCFIICSPECEESSVQFENCLFVMKKVPDYQEQYNLGKAENELEWLEWGMHGLNFDREYNEIKSKFNFSNLISKDDI